MVILNIVTLSVSINYHWYLFAYTSVVNGKEEIQTVIKPYQTTGILFTPEVLNILAEEIKSKSAPTSENLKIISVSYLGGATMDKFGLK